MIATASGRCAYSELWQRTLELLSPLGVTEADVPEQWAAAECLDPLCHLASASWRVGGGDGEMAVCRSFRLTGPAADAVVTLVLPAAGRHLPLFTAELFQIGGRPAHAYIDLRAPGLTADVRNEISEQTTVLAIRHAPLLPVYDSPPQWVIEDSPGGFLYTHSADHGAPDRLAQAYEDYLNVWLDFAFAGAADSAGDFGLDEFKRRAAARSPVGPLLTTFFPAEWCRRFVSEFLYR